MLKKVLFIITLLVLVACNKRTDQITITGKDGTNGHGGTNGLNGKSIVSTYNESSELECQSGGQRLDLYLDMDYSLSVTEGDQYMNSLTVCNGSNGLSGIDGVSGTDGENGEDGVNGEDGEQGIQGPVGEMGPQGLIGLVGPQGLAGPQGLQGVQGTPGAIGPQGISGLPGPTGSQGATGPQGIQGPIGSSGTTIKLYASSSCTLITGTTRYVKVQGSNVQFFSSSNCASNTKLAEMSQGESFWVTGNVLAVYDDSSVRVITFN